jgi:hypothetical protein
MIAGHLVMGLLVAAALESALDRPCYGIVVVLVAALVAAATVEVPQVGLVQFDENVGGALGWALRFTGQAPGA